MIPTLLNGAVLLDKPMGITSHDVVARLRYVLRTKRIGHTGTLDPFATGLLILCVGSSTRLSQFLTGKDKTYHATMRLGFATDTQDYTGKPISEPNSTEAVTEDNLREAMRHYTGDYAQVPPMYSAKKVDGISLHRLARQGQVVFRSTAPVKIYELTLTPDEHGNTIRHNETGTVDVDFAVSCSAGTYIRTLAHDIGQHLGCGAHLTALRRTRVGPFTIEQATTIEQLAGLPMEQIRASLLKPVELLKDWKLFQVSVTDHLKFVQGQAIPLDISGLDPISEESDLLVGICTESNDLLGIARLDSKGKARPQVVFNE